MTSPRQGRWSSPQYGEPRAIEDSEWKAKKRTSLSAPFPAYGSSLHIFRNLTNLEL